ncbi:hypothetical protein BDZ89DRAFT_989250 [Hymenopellis radicata]|nr:hypothetical protein BDZ89DRAFT_989250 [Hymenopellis radicata]
MPPTRSTKRNAPKSKHDPSAFIALQYGKRPPHIISRKEVEYDYEAAILVAQKEFPQLERATGIDFVTTELALCEGEAMVISPAVWTEVVSSSEVTKLVVITNKDKLEAEKASAEDVAANDFDILYVSYEQDTKVLSLSVKPSDSFDVIRELIQKRLGISPCEQRLIYEGCRIQEDHDLYSTGFRNKATINLFRTQDGGKPVIYLFSPSEMSVRVKLSLVPEWSFSAIYPVVPQKRLVAGPMAEEIVWNVKTHSDGTLTETNTGLDVSYLYWEARTNPLSTQLSPPPSPTVGQGKEDMAFNPASSGFNDTNAVLLAVSTITPYLDSALRTLGLDTEARTSFITYWLPSLLKHEHVVLRFVSQAAYEQSARLDIVPTPDVVTRVFMLFRRVKEEELDLWPAANARASEPVDFWRDVIGVEKRERQNDASLFRVLEWGGMEVF